MATMKKQRQRLTMKMKRVLGLDIALARKVARHVLDSKGYSEDIKGELDAALGKGTYWPGCKCCGDSSTIWNGKHGWLTHKYGSFNLEEKHT